MDNLKLSPSERILQGTNRGADVFKFYFGPDILSKGFGHNFCNVLRGEKNPSCRMRWSKVSRKWCLHDFAHNEEWSGDCFHLVAKAEGFGDTNWSNRGGGSALDKAMRAIDQHFHLGVFSDRKSENNYNLGKNKVTAKVKFADEGTTSGARLVKYHTRDFNESDLAFWGKYGINKETLDRYHVVALERRTLERPDKTTFNIYGNYKGHPQYAYLFNDGKTMKVYSPNPQTNAKGQPYPRFNWYNKTGETVIFGKEQLPEYGDRVYITGGEKDVMSLAAHGFNAISFNSETARIDENVLDDLAARFDNIIIMYDSDETGRKESKARFDELKYDYPVTRVELPFEKKEAEPGQKPDKDISDFFKLGHTADELRNLTDDAIARTPRRTQRITL